MAALQAMERNFWAVAGLTKAVLPHMLDEQEGHIIVVGGEEAVLAATEASGHQASSRSNVAVVCTKFPTDFENFYNLSARSFVNVPQA